MNTGDSFKKKLDLMLSRNSFKKRTNVKPTTTTIADNYNDIDKLLMIYSGKKINYTDNEIKQDLALFR